MTKPTALAALVTLAATAGSAAADGKKPLEVQVFTAGPSAFLVDSTLVLGDKEAILVDAQFTLSEAHRLVAQLLETKKTLTTVYITHDHPDHYFGLQVIQQAFPRAKIVALPAVITEMKKTAKAKAAYWGGVYGTLVTTAPVIPSPLAGPTLTVDGVPLEIHGPVQGDDATNTFVWIPSITTVIAGDIVYRGVHPWTAETTAASRAGWEKTLDAVAALEPTRVIAGHKDPKLDDSPAGLAETKAYLVDFDAAVASSKSSAEVQAKIKAKYGKLQLDVILGIGADAAFPPAK